MARQIVATTVAVMCLAFASLAAAANVTYVMKNGDRHSGNLVYHKDMNLGLVVNGQEQTYPIGEIAAILYDGGNPSQGELAQLPTSDNPPELERHTLVLRNGRVLHGKVYHWNSDEVLFDTTSGRGTYNAGDIARLYLSGPPARSVFSNSTDRNAAGNAGRGRGWGRGRERGTNSGQAQATVRVEANVRWTDTGILVQGGEQISFSSNGTIQFGANMAAGPDGNRDLPARTAYPVRNMPVGGLIGRIDNAPAFAIGSTTSPMPMPASGRLYLGVNDDDFRDNSGGFDVSIYRR